MRNNAPIAHNTPQSVSLSTSKEMIAYKPLQGLINASRHEIAIRGSIQAGFPTPSEEDYGEAITFDEYLIDNREATYILRVKGDSMIDAGILEGDLVIVERGRQAKEGDIIIAEIDGSWTMKYYRRKTGKVYLEPANSAYPLIFPQEELKITAVVTAVVRKYSK